MSQNPTNIIWDHTGTSGVATYGSDANLNVIFYKRSVLNPAKSREAGIAIHEDVDYVKMFQPGENLNVIERPVNEGDKIRFPQQWARFLQNQTQAPEGTPISLLFPNNPGVADNLRVSFGIHTIQQLAALTEHAMSSIGMGALDYKQKAVRFLDAAKESGSFHLMQDELQKQKDANYTLTRQVNELSALVKTLQDQLANPNKFSLSNPVLPANADIQTDRINATHITSDPLMKRATV